MTSFADTLKALPFEDLMHQKHSAEAWANDLTIAAHNRIAYAEMVRLIQAELDFRRLA